MVQRPRRAVTMADVAREAGVSRTAVSLVLNAHDEVAIPQVTRDRIYRAVSDLRYRPNAAARGLALQRTGCFGMVTEIVTAPFAVDIISGAQAQAWHDERFLLIAASETDTELDAAAVEKLLEQRVEGIIIAATFHRAIEVPANANDVPCVLINCFDANGTHPSIVPDEVGGGRKAARLLLEAGHERIAHITLEPGIPAQVGRLAGFRSELAAAGVELVDENIIAGDGTAESGFRSACELLDRADRPTAIFCGNDRMAMGAYDAIKERGLSIPDDISVLGFDDQEIIAAHLRPSLTTVALPFEEMGARGVSMLTSLTAGSAISDLRVEIDCPLQIRSSVGLALR